MKEEVTRKMKIINTTLTHNNLTKALKREFYSTGTGGVGLSQEHDAWTASKLRKTKQENSIFAQRII